MTSDETLELLRSAVSLRVQGREVPERVRRELAMVESTVIGIVGPLVRKRVAARLLGVSVQALDRWIAKGALPVEPIADGSARTAIPTEAVIGVAAELAWRADDAALGRAVDAWRDRRQREHEWVDARNLTLFLHQIASSRSEQEGRPVGALLDADELIRVLNDNGVEFVVVGVFAMLAHNATRGTEDLDIVPDPSPRNLDRLSTAVQSLDAVPLTIDDAQRDWSREQLDEGGNWILATRAGRLDVLQYVSGVDGYDQLRTNAVDIVSAAGGRIWFAGKDDLISMKRAAGRPQDLLDIERIERGGDPITGF